MAETVQTLPRDTQLFCDIFSASPVGIAVETLEGQPLFVNPALCSMLGFSEEEMCTKHWLQFSPPEDAEKDWTLFQQLRAGSIDHYRIEKRYFRQDGSLVWGQLSVSLLKGRPSPLVVAMVEDITEKKKAEEALRTSEERLRLAQQAARIGAFEWNIQTGVDTWTPELESMHGLWPGGFSGKQAVWEELLHPDDRARVLELVNQSLKTGLPMQAEWRIVWPDGSVHWIAGRWRVLTNDSGEPSRMVGVNLDVTDRKRTEEALLGTNRRLIEAQEKERHRIARELHDDIGQRLALLAVELAQMQDSPTEGRSRLQELHKQVTEISDDVQAISHELHSSKLDYLGIVVAAKNFCKEFGETHKAEVDFQSHDVPADLPAEVSISLFRVLQEALCNAVKHSGVKRIEVQLREESDEIRLEIRDLGKGFDVEAAQKGRGLGLTSMQERVHAVNGKIAIESKLMGGTTIHVRIPFGSEKLSERAVG